MRYAVAAIVFGLIVLVISWGVNAIRNVVPERKNTLKL